MSTLAYTTTDHAPAVPADAKPARKPFWSRILETLAASQQRRAEREIARYLASHGHLLTDDAERQIMRHLAGGSRTPL